jgi:hypothetical protein
VEETRALIPSALGVEFARLAKTLPVKPLEQLTSHILDGPHVTRTTPRRCCGRAICHSQEHGKWQTESGRCEPHSPMRTTGCSRRGVSPSMAMFSTQRMVRQGADLALWKHTRNSVLCERRAHQAAAETSSMDAILSIF